MRLFTLTVMVFAILAAVVHAQATEVLGHKAVHHEMAAACPVLAYSQTMRYLSPAGYARLRLYTETGIWESDPIAATQADVNAYSEMYGFMSAGGAARLAIHQRFGVWLTPDEALAVSDYGDDTFSFQQVLDERIASAK
jgi:hypothetical protein